MKPLKVLVYPSLALSSCTFAFLLVAMPLAMGQTDGNWAVNAAGNWSDAGNWSSDPAVPGGAESVIGLTHGITANRTVTIDTTDRTVGILNIGSGSWPSYTLNTSGSAALTLDNGASDAQINFLSGNNPTVNAPLILNSSLVINNTATAAAINTSASLTAGTPGAKIISHESTGSGVTSLTLPTGTTTFTDIGLVQNSSTSRLHLAGSVGGTYTFTEGVEINGGVLSMFWGAHLGSSNLTFNNASYWRQGVSGGSFASGNVSMGGSFTLNNPDDTGNQGALTMSGPVTLTSDTNIIVYGNNGHLTLSNVVSGDYSLTKSGPRPLTLTNANTFTGGFTLSEGTTIASNHATVLGTGDLALEGGTLQLGNSTFALTFGNDTTVSGDVTLTSTRTANTGSGLTHTLGTLEIGSNTLTVDLSSTQASGTGGFTFGTTTVTGDAGFNIVNGDAATRLNLGALNGAGTITKEGDGTLRLTTAAGNYSGTTTVNNGALVLDVANALGNTALVVDGGTVIAPSAAALSNSSIILGGGVYQKDLANAEQYTNYLTATSGFDGGIATDATFLGGVAGGSRSVATGFATSPLDSVSNDGLRSSDIFTISGTGTDIFVLQLGIDSVSTANFLGWVENGVWVNAIDGNSALGGSAIQGFLGSYAAAGASANSDYLGSWGVDVDNGNVWAILDHNSEFAVIPEPRAMALMAAVCALAVAFLRRRR